MTDNKYNSFNKMVSVIIRNCKDNTCKSEVLDLCSHLFKSILTLETLYANALSNSIFNHTHIPLQTKYIEIAYAPELTPIINMDVEMHDVLYYNEFTIDKSLLYELIRKNIIKYMENEYLPNPSMILIGEELDTCVSGGKLPDKQFEFSNMLFNIKIIYVPHISGVVLL